MRLFNPTGTLFGLMLTPLLDDDLAPVGGAKAAPTEAPDSPIPTARPMAAMDDATLLRGLLEDGPLGGVHGGGSDKKKLSFDLDEDGDNSRFQPLSETHLDDILRVSQQMKASDIHLSVGLPPMVRQDGKLTPTKWESVTPRESQRLVYDILTTEQIEKFENTKELDFSYGVTNIGRFRFNVYKQRGSVGCAMRAIPAKIPSLDQLRMPAYFARTDAQASAALSWLPAQPVPVNRPRLRP